MRAASASLHSLSVLLVAGALLLVATPARAVPATLACAGRLEMNWRAEAPEPITTSDEFELGSPIVHLDPASGSWYLEKPGSRALTVDGGTFEIVREGDFARYYDEWVGIDQDTMLRIWGGGDTSLRFLFVSRDHGLVIGQCSEPDEPFIFLRSD